MEKLTQAEKATKRVKDGADPVKDALYDLPSSEVASPGPRGDHPLFVRSPGVNLVIRGANHRVADQKDLATHIQAMSFYREGSRWDSSHLPAGCLELKTGLSETMPFHESGLPASGVSCEYLRRMQDFHLLKSMLYVSLLV